MFTNILNDSKHNRIRVGCIRKKRKKEKEVPNWKVWKIIFESALPFIQ